MMRPMLAAQKYRSAGDLWGPLHEKVAAGHLLRDGYLIVQPKIDGMRCCFDEGVARSRSWKPLGNKFLQKLAQAHGDINMDGSDAEVVAGHIYDPNVFRESMSGIRAEDGSPEFTVYLFDTFYRPEWPYTKRRGLAEILVGKTGGLVQGIDWAAKIVLCPQIQVSSLEQLYEEERRLVELGWEGAIVRRHNMPYKFGRATALGGELVKVKRRQTIDAVITGYGAWEENQNEATTSALGYTTRSAHQEGKQALERLGYWKVRRLDEVTRTPTGPEFKVGVFRNVSHADRDRLWTDRESYIGKYCELSIDGASGGYEAPRCPVLLRFRSDFEF